MPLTTELKKQDSIIRSFMDEVFPTPEQLTADWRRRRPGDPDAAEERLLRLCCVMSWFEAFHRNPHRPAPMLAGDDPDAIDGAKIECARKFFASLNEKNGQDVKYDVVTDYTELMQLVAG